MKKRLLCVLLACACLLAGLQASAANGAGDSLVSVSYLNGAFLSNMEALIQNRVKEGTKAVYDAAAARLDALGTGKLTGSGTPAGTVSGWSYSDTPQMQSLSRGDVIALSTGSSVFLGAGTVSASAGLVDATAGSELAAGDLSAGHRCINGQEGQPATVTVLSDSARLMVEGNWTAVRSGEPATAFTDLVKSRDWYYDAVYWAVGQGLFEGVTAEIFAPLGITSRATFATLLYRMEGRPAVSYSGSFSDVPDKRWFSAGVEWAARTGVVEGDNGRFIPDQNVTREQIAVMLYRYAKDYLGLDVSQSGELTSRPDGDSVSSWARTAMAWAVGTGIITGGDGNRLLPRVEANRAQVSIMLQRFQTWAGRAGAPD